MIVSSTVRERLANYAHEAWSGWMKYMFEKMTINEDGTAIMPKWAVDRWTFQVSKTYDELPEDMKESDRQEADRMIAIVKADEDDMLREQANRDLSNAQLGKLQV